MGTYRQYLAALATALLLTACAPGSAQMGSSGPSTMREAATVKVANQNWSDMVIYVVRSGQRIRLGEVTSMTAKIFRMPASVLNAAGAISLVADPIGSPNEHVTDRIHVSPGQQVEFRIENHIAVSSIAVWNRH